MHHRLEFPHWNSGLFNEKLFQWENMGLKFPEKEIIHEKSSLFPPLINIYKCYLILASEFINLLFHGI